MRYKRNKLIVFLVLIIGLAYHYLEKNDSQPQKEVLGAKDAIKQDTLSFDYLPSSTTGQIVHHDAYVLSYNEKHEQAEWVAYTLRKDKIIHTNMKRPFFIQDPKVRTKSADWRNYKKSGYDKGHLCPAGDRKSSRKLYTETFYTSNVTPQKHSFNAGIWNRLEQKVRYWAKKYKHLYIITGGVLTSKNNKVIGKEKVTVPSAFYKVILDYTEPEVKAIAFLIPHKESSKPLYDFAISIDELEQKTGIDFFPKLPDDIETRLERKVDYKKWSFR